MPAYGYEHRDGVVALDEVGLHYLEWAEAGAGADVLIIHGIMGVGVRWDRFAGSLMDDFHVVAPDLRGHGHVRGPTRATAARMVNEMPDARLVEMPDTTHSLQVEDPENFNRIAGDFPRQ